jgi:ABC-type lipoprotein release transport system permease subunit
MTGTVPALAKDAGRDAIGQCALVLLLSSVTAAVIPAARAAGVGVMQALQSE